MPGPRPIPASARVWVVPLLALLASLLSAALASAFAWSSANAKDERRFQEIFDETHDAIETRLQNYSSLLDATTAYFSAASATDGLLPREEFHAYGERLNLRNRFPGMQGLGFALRVPGAEVAQTENRLHTQGVPDFHIWPKEEALEHFPVLFLEPRDRRNAAALGYDMFSDPVRREAMERACDTGHATATGPVTLVQEISPEKQRGFLIYVPVYRNGSVPATLAERRAALIGFVYAPFRAGDLLQSLRIGLPQSEVRWRIFDGAASPETLLYDSQPDQPPPDKARLTHEETLDVYGRAWKIRYFVQPSFEAASERGLVPFILLAGTVVGMLLFISTREQGRAQLAAERNAEELERSSLALREQQETLRLVMNGVPAPIAYVGPDRTCRVTNRACEEWFGRPQQAMHGRPLHEAFGAEADATLAPYMTAALAGKAADFEARLRHRDGSIRHVRGAFIPHIGHAGTVEGFIALLFDVTDLEEARAAAQRAVQIRDEFLSIASHELKTPLTALRLQVANLLRGLARGLLAERERSAMEPKLQLLERQLRRLTLLVDDLLDISRLQAGKLRLQLEEVDLTQVTAEVASRLRDEAQRAGSPVTIEAGAPIIGQWDALRVDQIVTNLLSNAVKYGRGQPIEISISQEGSIARLAVCDRGIGIAVEDQPRIFQRFERAVSERNYGGFGLGLWITRQITEALGGTVHVESALGQGSTFIVELPLAGPGSARAS